MAKDPGTLSAYLLRLACLGQAKYESYVLEQSINRDSNTFSSPEVLTYTQVCIDRDTVQIKCLAQKHYAMSLTSVRTRTTENPKY